jgi:3-oxoadipate enol-lactonase
MVITTSSCGFEGGCIVYDRVGSGPLVLFLHGIGGNRSNWTGQLIALGSEYTCVAWDAMGYGDSSDPKIGIPFDHFADELTVLLNHLRVKRAHLVGLSMGGMIAQSFYANHPDRVATLTLASTSAGFGVLSDEAKADFVARRLEPLVKGVSLENIADSLLPVLAGRKATPAIRERLKQSLLAIHKDAYMLTARAVVETDFRPLLSRILAPTFVIVGEDDRVLPPSESAYLAAEIPGATFSQLGETGHLCNIESSLEFNAQLKAFLDLHRDRATDLHDSAQCP